MIRDALPIINGEEMKPIAVFITLDWRHVELMLLPLTLVHRTEIISCADVLTGNHSLPDIFVKVIPKERQDLMKFFKALCNLDIRTATIVSSSPLPEVVMRRYGRHMRVIKSKHKIMTDAEYDEMRAGIMSESESILEMLMNRPLDITYR